MSLICKEDLLKIYEDKQKERMLNGCSFATCISLKGVIKTILEFPEVPGGDKTKASGEAIDKSVNER